MNFLSKRRRHKAARPLLLVLALMMVGLAYSVVSPQQTSAETEMSQQVEEGRQLYQVSCSSCHGLNGEGNTLGPSLIGVGSASVDFMVATGRMPAARPEAQIPARTPLYSQEQVDALSAYISTWGPGIESPTEAQYSPEGLSEEEIARGGALFRANCSSCHGIIGNGGALPDGKYAPSLIGTENIHIWQAMRTGPQQMPVFSRDVISDDDTRSIIGYLNEAHEQPTFGGLGMGEEGPVSEGFWVFIIGIGGIALVATWIAKKGARAR